MIHRLYYSLGMAWQHRARLRVYRRQRALQCKTVLDLDLSAVKAQGIRALALDFDGVLASYGEREISPTIGSWLNNSIEVFGQGKVFILTNKPTEARESYFSEHFKGVILVRAARKKPYPEGIFQILQRVKIEARELLVVDDRLLTGILAAIIAETTACYITKPWINLRKRPVPELFFMSLRIIERLIV